MSHPVRTLPVAHFFQVNTVQRFKHLTCACFVLTSAHAQSDADQSNNFYKYSNHQLEAVCAGMSPHSHVSGLTDGAWAAVPFTGRTYFYKSACYYELARRTGRIEWCNKVVERKTLLGNGSSMSPQSCQRMVTQAIESSRAQQIESERHAAAVKGAFKLGPLQVKPSPSGDWQISAATSGSLPGHYRFEVFSARGKRSLLNETVMLTSARQHSWAIRRAELTAGNPLPDIFPVSVSVYYLLPPGSNYPNEAYLTSIQNATLSAE